MTNETPATTKPLDGEAERNITFLRACADWFRSEAADAKEDKAHWANIYHAQNCDKAADFLSRSTQKEATEEEVEAGARAIYELEPFYMPTGQMHDGVEIARKFSFDEAPAYRQSRARDFAKVVLSAKAGLRIVKEAT